MENEGSDDTEQKELFVMIHSNDLDEDNNDPESQPDGSSASSETHDHSNKAMDGNGAPKWNWSKEIGDDNSDQPKEVDLLMKQDINAGGKKHETKLKEQECEMRMPEYGDVLRENTELTSKLKTLELQIKSQETAWQLEEKQFNTELKRLSQNEKEYRDLSARLKSEKLSIIQEHEREINLLKDRHEKLHEHLKDTARNFESQKRVNTELVEKQMRLQQENGKQKQDLEDAQTTIKRLTSSNKYHASLVKQQGFDIKQQQFQIQQHLFSINQQNEIVANLRQDLLTAEEEQNKLILRLRKLAGAHLTRDNPNIADLSDENRPTKLAEKYSELNDNEWTDAFEELCDLPGKDEVTSIGDMLDLLKITYEACVQLSKPHRDTLRNLTTVILNVNKCPVKDKGQTTTDISFEDQCVQTEITCISQSFQTDINGYDVDKGNRGSIHTNQLENSDSQSIELSGRRDENDDQALPSKNDNGQNSQTTTDLQSSGTSNIGEPSHEPMEGDLADAEEPTAEEGASPTHGVGGPVEGLTDESNSDDSKCQAHKEDIGVTEAGVTQTRGKTDLREHTEDQQLEIQSVDDKQLKYDFVKDTEVPKLPEGFSSNVDTGEVKNTEVPKLPEGFSSNVDTGEITAEVKIQVEFSSEQKKTMSNMIKMCVTKLEHEKELSKVIAQKVAFERNIDVEKQTRLMAYITKCAQLCWYMVIQEPPVVIEFQDKVTGEPFNKDVYKAYTKIGKMLDFIVWPPLYLHKNGPMLSKGTAQGTEYI